MKVLHLCPLWHPVAQRSRGATERFLFDLISQLDALGVESTVVASGKSRPMAELIPALEGSLEEETAAGRAWQPYHHELHEVMTALELAPEFDVIHSHLHFGGYVLSAVDEIRDRVLHTVHHTVTRDLERLVSCHPDLALCAATGGETQRLRDHGADNCHTIGYGVDLERLALQVRPAGELVFTGDISRDSGADLAVALALTSGRALTLAGSIPRGEEAFFETEIKPRFTPQVTYAGDPGPSEIIGLLADAACNLSLPRWQESFPLSALEAMACGTPTLGLRRGMSPGVVEPGRSGHLADREDELNDLVEQTIGLERAQVRACAEARFDIRDVARRYLERYEHLCAAASPAQPARRARPRSRGEHLKVLHLAPLWLPVSTDSFGGIETLLPPLIGALTRLGCRNTLLASGDSVSEAALVPMVERNLVDEMGRGEAFEYEPYAFHEVMTAIEDADRFDVIHSHLPHGYALSGIEGLAPRVLHTLHEWVTPDLAWFVARHPDLTLAAISEFQARRLRAQGATRCHLVPNGIDVSSFPFQSQPNAGLVFLGAMRYQKGPDTAVQVAAETGLPLQLAGAISGPFFDRQVRPFLNQRVRYLGVLDHQRKSALLGNAACLLMPSRWEEPFGLVALEAMACGTPVVALANGALPEIVQDGVNGYLAGAEDELAGLVERAQRLDRRRVRASIAARFDIDLVARRYLDIYQQIAGR